MSFFFQGSWLLYKSDLCQCLYLRQCSYKSDLRQYLIIPSITKTHSKKVTNEKITPRDQCNCNYKTDCPLDGNCQTSDIIYKCIASTTVNPDKIYLGTAEGNFKKRYYNHKTSFKNREKANDTTLSKYVWEVKDK